MKKITTLLICLALFAFSPLHAFAESVPAPHTRLYIEELPKQPRYINISTTTLQSGDDWICASLSTHKNHSLSISVKVYCNDRYETTLNASKTGNFCLLDEDYRFVSGNKYSMRTTYKAGSETVTKTLIYYA